MINFQNTINQPPNLPQLCIYTIYEVCQSSSHGGKIFSNIIILVLLSKVMETFAALNLVLVLGLLLMDIFYTILNNVLVYVLSVEMRTSKSFNF